MFFDLILPTFIAGLLTFFAPCTLPLVPAYLGFIGGVTANDLKGLGVTQGVRRKIVLNGLMYVIGFSLVFMALGLIFGLLGTALVSVRLWLIRLGGVLIVFFGLFLLNAFTSVSALRFLQQTVRLPFSHHLHPGKPLSAFLFGATFALGWTPCIGPILGSILLLVSSYTTALEGTFLLLIFSLGLAIPFLLLAFSISHLSQMTKRLQKVLPFVSLIGGVFLIFLGILLMTDQLALWLRWMYTLTNGVGENWLLKYL